jgi:DNA-binding protein
MSKELNTIYIGSKPTMNYALAVITNFNQSEAKEVTLKARGRAITTAVDVTEIVRHRFMKDLKVGNVELGTEEMPPREGENRSRMVSTIEITLKR